jgi:L-ascorbate metabolism protein UlaG (beta-lactamase superfamily)
MGAAKQRTFIGTLTLSARMLAELARLLRPQATLPVHFGTFSHYLEPIDAVRALPDKSIRIPTPGEALSFEISRRSAP